MPLFAYVGLLTMKLDQQGLLKEPSRKGKTGASDKEHPNKHSNTIARFIAVKR